MKPLVIYHDQCMDGFCAAWLFHKANPEAEFHAANYGQQPPDVSGREVYIVDFSYKRPVMIELTQRAAKLVCLDHHKTAAAELQGLSAGSNEGLIRFDMTKSGGRLAWEYLFRATSAVWQPGASIGKAPWLVDYTEDRDLWLWKLPLSKEVNAALSSCPRDFTRWDVLATSDPRQDPRLAQEGTAILRYHQQTVDAQAANAVEIEMDGYRVLSLNATTLISEIGEKLAKDRPFSATWFVRNDGVKVWSLRSCGENGVDVSAIAKAHGGGGHKNAAGFQE